MRDQAYNYSRTKAPSVFTKTRELLVAKENYAKVRTSYSWYYQWSSYLWFAIMAQFLPSSRLTCHYTCFWTTNTISWLSFYLPFAVFSYVKHLQVVELYSSRLIFVHQRCCSASVHQNFSIMYWHISLEFNWHSDFADISKRFIDGVCYLSYWLRSQVAK